MVYSERYSTTAFSTQGLLAARNFVQRISPNFPFQIFGWGLRAGYPTEGPSLETLKFWLYLKPAMTCLFVFVRKTPHKVEFGDKVKITKARCGIDGTMFLTDTGTLFACGK
jgi:hypothetical protein